DEMGVEPLFREQMPELFARHAHLHALGDSMLMADGNEARARSFAMLFEAVLRMWVKGEVKGAGVEQWLEFRARVRHVLAAVRSEARGQRIAVFTSAGAGAGAAQRAPGAGAVAALSPAFRARPSSGPARP